MIALALGTTGGLLAFAFGPATDMFALDGENVIRIAFLFAITPLQHTHVWIPFTGRLGRILISPAHHQLHHSTDPAHFNKNLGSSLAVWDWLFGTLQIPTRERQRLTFGIEPVQREHHSAFGTMMRPVVEAFAKVLPSGRQPVPVQSSNLER
jgi:sterol desaturase/sphingolipid hydroxylase (fatty acid hydroxylase superfamily)